LFTNNTLAEAAIKNKARYAGPFLGVVNTIDILFTSYWFTLPVVG